MLGTFIAIIHPEYDALPRRNENMKIGTVKPAVIAAAFAFTAVAASAYGTNDYEMILKTCAKDDRVEICKLFYAAAESGGGVAE